MATDYFVGSGCTFANITSAIASIPANLAGTGIHNVYLKAETYTLVGGIIKNNGSAADYINVQAATGSAHSGVWGAGPVISSAAAVRTGYTKISDITFRHGSSKICEMSVDPNHIEFNRVFFDCIGGLQNVAEFIGVGTGCKMVNCLIYQSTGTAAALGYRCAATNPTEFYNCTAYGVQAGFTSNSGIVKNCVAVCGTTDFTNNLGIEDYNASVDGTAIGANSKTLTTGQMAFTDSSAANFKPLGNSELLGAGADLSSDHTDDITGTTVPSGEWMIGSYWTERPSMGGLLGVISRHHRKRR